jgi:hypothetical protein
MINKKKLIIIVFILVIALTIFLISNILLQATSKNEGDNINNTAQKLSQLKKTEEITFIPDKGVDTNSIVVKDSIKNIEVLSLKLPYQEKFTTEEGVEVEIAINDITLELQNWILPVNVWGIDYQVPEDDPEYQNQKKAFIQASLRVYDFINSQDIDPSKIIISWGGREFIRTTAERWLAE